MINLISKKIWNYIFVAAKQFLTWEEKLFLQTFFSPFQQGERGRRTSASKITQQIMFWTWRRVNACNATHVTVLIIYCQISLSNFDDVCNLTQIPNAKHIGQLHAVHQLARHTLPASSRKKQQLDTNCIAIELEVKRTFSRSRDCRKETLRWFLWSCQMKPLVYIVTQWW